ncbi:hypothetical protein MROS_2634 [Melioribacter roseus P3M-2]|uniref:Uncharacterized protein n=1 Tax=Melioribacter roseus (strain DSM 23840 / JCM 17771 / VKM B-2668 / P3M-2) TaxID=1191523 RepID=I6ZV12_MELRP|nr:hypothetical protein [Melioribacter roseus]AFN75864.1 hypothetical protein MROS_2634 [Melioribacter roseus P3M-2]
MIKRIPNLLIFFIFVTVSQMNAQFIDEFNGKELQYDPDGLNGWTFFSGDGNAEVKFIQKDGYASVRVDASKDKRGLWWALIRRRISEGMDLSLIQKPNYEFRIEAKIKVSSAPKRVNLHLNTQRTTDFHTHLMEYDIPDTSNWHVISMTTKNFDARPGDNVFAQMALMDWGFDKYRVDIDYFKVDIVRVDTIGNDLGEPIPYHPPVPEISSFEHRLPVAEDATIDLEFTDYNFNNWSATDEKGNIVKLLTVSGNQYVILKWNFENYKNMKVTGPAVLELTTYSLQNSPDYKKDFGMIRVVEILDGKDNWLDENITFEALTEGKTISEVFNSQMIIDCEVNKLRGEKNYFVISRPVMQRLLDGKTKGIVIKPLGSVVASFYASENNINVPCIYFNTEK